jgi:malonate decarboxylase gamma subunit
LLALEAPDVLVHAMGKQAAARITRRSVADLDEMGDRFPPMAYDIGNYAKLGLRTISPARGWGMRRA